MEKLWVVVGVIICFSLVLGVICCIATFIDQCYQAAKKVNATQDKILKTLEQIDEQYPVVINAEKKNNKGYLKKRR